MPLLFSYGSNHPEQLAQRLGHPVDGTPAHLPGWGRTFRGHSTRWGGAVANIEPDLARSVYGYVTEVSERDLDVLDLVEGVSLGLYRRVRLAVHVRSPGGRDRLREAVAYVRARPASQDPLGAPSRDYLAAVTRTIASFWRNADGSLVTPADLLVPVDVPRPRNSSVGVFLRGAASPRP